MKDKLLRVLFGSLAATATQVVQIHGIPPWLGILCTTVAGLAGIMSPSLVGVQKDPPKLQ